MAELYGVDISEHQGAINWDQLNEVSNFVIMRASLGTARRDYQFQRNQSEARRVRMDAGPLGIGYYYFAYPTLVDAVTSANYFIDNLGALEAGEMLVLDLEGSVGSAPVAWSLAFLEHVEFRTGVKPLIYLNQSLVHSYNWSPVINNGYGLWLADYDGNKTSLPPATPWPVVAMKQWTDVDIVAGIPSKVDGDTFYGTFDQFYAYGYKPNPPIPSITTATTTTTTTTVTATTQTTTTLPPVLDPGPNPVPVPPPNSGSPLPPDTSLLGRIITWLRKLFNLEI